MASELMSECAPVLPNWLPLFQLLLLNILMIAIDTCTIVLEYYDIVVISEYPLLRNYPDDLFIVLSTVLTDVVLLRIERWVNIFILL